MKNESNKKLAKFSKKIITFLTYSCVFVPIFFWLKSIFPMVIPKTLLFRGIVELMLIFYLILIYADKTFLPKFNKFNLSLIIFTVISFISGFFGVNPFHSMFSTAERMMGNFGFLHYIVFFFIISNTIKNKEIWLKIIKFWVWVSGIISLLFYLVTIIPNSPISFLNSEVGRYVGFSGNSTFTGVFLLMQAMLCLYLFFEDIEKENGKFHFFFLFILNGYLLFLTGCRGAMLSLLTSIGILLISLSILDNPKISKMFHCNVRKLATVSLLLMVFLGVIFVSLRESPLIKNNVPLQRLTSIPFLTASAISRLMVGRIAIKTFIQKPLIGWGPENFEIAYQRNYSLKVAEVLPSDNRFDKVHNMPLEILSTTGILGFLAYISIFVLFYKELKKNESFDFWPKMILILTILGYFIQNVFLFDVIEGLVPLFLIFAYINSQIPPLNISFSKVSFPKWLQTILLIFAVSGLLTTIYVYNIKPLRISSLVIASKGLTKQGRIEEAIRVMRLNYQSHVFIEDFFVFGDLDYLVGGDLTKLTNDQLNTYYSLIYNQIKYLSEKQPLNLRLYVARLLTILVRSRIDNKSLDKESILEARTLKKEIESTKLYLPDIDFYYAQILLQSGSIKDQEESIELFKDFYKKFPKLVRAPWYIGNYLVEHGQVKEGLKYLQDAIHTAPVFNNPKDALAGINLFLKYNDPKTALELALMLEKEVKNEPLVFLTISKVYIANNDSKKALEYIMKAKQLYDIYAVRKTDPAMEKEINKILSQLTK